MMTASVFLLAVILLYAIYRGHSVKFSIRMPGAAVRLSAKSDAKAGDSRKRLAGN